MEIIKKIISTIRWENMAPGTEFAGDFCAVIGPLQLGVVLVIMFLSLVTLRTFIKINECRGLNTIVSFYYPLKLHEI